MTSALWVLAGATAAGFPGSPSPFVQAAPAKTHSDMVLVPGGEFEMGSSERDLETAMEVFDIGRRGPLVPEMPRHRVKIDSFWIERYLVTNAQFRDFVEQYRQWSKGRIKDSLHNKHYLEHWNGTEPPAELGNVPAVNVSWYAAEAYCRWQGGHLPTEAQWEWAARGGQEKPEFPWGNEMPDDSKANWNGDGIDHPVSGGKYPPNGYGIYHLAGNAWEFCLDKWQEHYYSSSPILNPLAGPETPDFDFLGVTTRRVIRGGSWGAAAINMRVTYRDCHPPRGAGDHVGFRCVKPSRLLAD